MKSLTSKFNARELIWLLVIAVVFAFFSRSQTDSALLSHLSLASAIVSIVLAVVAIVYTMMQSDNTSSVLHEIRREAQNLTVGTQQLNVEAKGIRRLQDEFLSRALVTVPEQQESEVTPSGIDLHGASYAAILALYWLARAASSRKASTLEILAEETGMPDTVKNHVQGFLMGVNCSLGSARMVSDGVTWQIENPPKQFRESVEAWLQAGIAKVASDDGNLRLAHGLEQAHAKVDEYFD